MSTRDAYGNTLLKLGHEERDIVVVDADLSASTKTNKFAGEFPDRFFNVGCAEQNLIGTAAGLAIAGKIVFASTYAMFSSRAWEQIRNTLSHDNLNVKIAASHSGLTNAPDGASHQSLEDIAIMRLIPNMCVFNPADAIETEKIIINEAHRKGPSYIRLNRISTPIIYTDNYEFKIGKSVEIRYGEDVTIIATGTMVVEALKASETLENEKISARVINIPTIKPLEKEEIIKAAKDTGHIITVEEHSIYGGLGGAIAEIIVENYPIPMKIMGVTDRFGESGEYPHLLSKFGLTARNIVNNTIQLIGEKR
jgi:transketolase